MNYEEQVRWNGLKELHRYVNSIDDMDDNLLRLVNAMMAGFESLLTPENKTTVMDHAEHLLRQIKERHVAFADARPAGRRRRR